MVHVKGRYNITLRPRKGRMWSLFQKWLLVLRYLINTSFTYMFSFFCIRHLILVMTTDVKWTGKPNPMFNKWKYVLIPGCSTPLAEIVLSHAPALTSCPSDAGPGPGRGRGRVTTSPRFVSGSKARCVMEPGAAIVRCSHAGLVGSGICSSHTSCLAINSWNISSGTTSTYNPWREENLVGGFSHP